MQNKLDKYAKLIAYVQVASAIGLGICSIWYGAWYPDAQAELHDALKAKDAALPKPGFWEVSRSGLAWNAPPIYTLACLLAGIMGGIGTLISASRLDELSKKEDEFKREEEEHADTQLHYYRSLEHHLIELFCNKIEKFDDSCRASVYRCDGSAFRMVFRYSKITKYHEKGRVTLPYGEGFLGATYMNGDDLYVKDLPERHAQKKAYAKAVAKQLAIYGADMTEVAINKLRMPSRCYYGYAIREDNSPNKIAILILESTEPDKFDSAGIKALLQSNSNKITHYVRHIAQLDGKLNPYGSA